MKKVKTAFRGTNIYIDTVDKSLSAFVLRNKKVIYFNNDDAMKFALQEMKEWIKQELRSIKIK